MADITMCINQSCPKKGSCFRFLARPSEFQSYAFFSGGDGDCAYYILSVNRPINSPRLDNPWDKNLFDNNTNY
jgi:hypothetical protein